MKKLIVRKMFTYALLSVFLTSSIFLASCKNAADGGVGSGGGGGGSAPSPTPSSSSSGSDAPLYYENPLTGDKTPIDDYDGDPTNIPFVDIKDKLPTPEFGNPGYENSDGGVFAGWSTDGRTILPDDSTENVAGLELKPVYDTAVVFTIYQYFTGNKNTLGIYKVAKVNVPTDGIEFDKIQQKVGVRTSDLQKDGYDFHWSTKENDTKLENTIKFTDKFKDTTNFYTAYDQYPTADNRKNPITPNDLFDSSGTSEWLQYTTEADGTPTYKYLIFTNVQFDPDDNTIFRVAFGKAETLEKAREKAYRARDAVDPFTGGPNFWYNPDNYTTEYATGLEIKTDGLVEVWTSPLTTFWMNNSGRIVAQTDGNTADTGNMYVAQK